MACNTPSDAMRQPAALKASWYYQFSWITP